MSLIRFSVIVVFGLLCFGRSLQSEVPRIITFQGRITDKAGNLLNGSYDVTFRLYDVQEGGSALWTETHSGVPVTRSIFAVPLGVNAALNLPFDVPYWVSLEVGAEGEMAPRQPLTSVPYALNSRHSAHALQADQATQASQATVATQAQGLTTGGATDLLDPAKNPAFMQALRDLIQQESPSYGVLEASPLELNLLVTRDGSASAPLTLTNTGAGPLSYTTNTAYGSGSGWLKLTPESGLLADGASRNHTVTASGEGLAEGTHTATFTFNGNQTNGAQSVPVTLTKTMGPADSYDVLFCTADGTGSEFVDSSTTNPKAITAHGNATQLCLPTALSGKRTAAFFNGTSDYVVVPDSDDWNFGTADYEVEFFLNIGTLQHSTILDLNTQNFWVFLGGNGHLTVTQAGTQRIDYTWNPSLHTWYKIKIARVSGTVTLYINDEPCGSPYTGSDNIQGGTSGFHIGRQTDAAQFYFSGWIKNLTVTKAGTTVLAMGFDTRADGPLSPAIYLDGSGDYLTLESSSDWAMGDFTLELMFSPSVNGGAANLIRIGPYATGAWITYYGNNTGYTFDGWINNTRLNQTLATPPVGKWISVALVRSGTKAYCFWDGRLLNPGGTEVGGAPLTAGTLAMGDTGFTGYIRELRVSNTPRYTASYTPTQTGFAVDANTKLYIKGDEDNGGTAFADQTGKVVTTNGDTKIKYTEDYRSCVFRDDSTSAHKSYPQGSAKVDFVAASGAGSYHGDGSTSYLMVENSDDLRFSTGDWTAEVFARVSTVPGYFLDMIAWPSGGWGLYVDGSRQIQTINGQTTSNGSPTAGMVNVNTWFHVAMSRAGGVTRVFVNGSEVYSVADAYDYQPSRQLEIGDWFYTYNSGRYGFLNGQVDNIRISKGIARYTTTFNPPEYP